MSIWMHKRLGKILISYPTFCRYEEVREQITLHSFAYAGDAIENENGVTFLVNPNWKEDFELIGEL